MQQIKQKETLNLLIRDKEVLQNIDLSITLDSNRKINLNFKDGISISDGEKNFTEKIYTFTDDDQKVSLKLRFNLYKDIVLSFVDAQIKKEEMPIRHHYFAPEEGIVIHIGDLGTITGLMANYQYSDWWTRPHFSTDLSTLPERTQSLLWKSEETYHYLLPVVDKVYKTELSGSAQGLDIKLSSYNGGYDRCETLAFAIGTGDDPFSLSKKTIEKVLEVLEFPTLPREKKRYPNKLDYLGWCSWDAFYREVSEKRIIEKMEELNQKELPVKWIMIDDGWLDVKDDRLRSFEADPEKFPEGFISTTSKLKEKYGIYWVGVWHTIAGYWSGVHPELAKNLQDSLYATNSNKFFPHPNCDKGFKFWDQWHSRLKKQGIDFVKVDSQSAINNFMMYQKSVGEAARGVHAGLEASVGIHFNHCLINCMGMAAENIFSRPISALSRNSDDFFPNRENSFREHALQNAYNSYYHGEFYWGDWDMFWTNHKESIQNAILRAVSGGPVYFSDPVGETDPAKIWPLILKDGQILRADQPGLPTKDCLFHNPQEEQLPLKIWNTINNTGVIAAFNIHSKEKQVNGSLSPSDVPNLKGERFAVLDYINQKVMILNKGEELPLSLEKHSAALYIILPFDDFTPIGLLNKYLAPATVTRFYQGERSLIIELAEGGTFGFVSKKQPVAAYVNNKKILIKTVHDQFYIVDCKDEEAEVVVEILFA